jgi:hypothetical protein
MPIIKESRSRTTDEQMKCNKTFEEVRKYGVCRKGMSYYEKFLAGGRLTLGETVMAMCWRCNGYGELTGCSSPDCPLYPYYLQSFASESRAELEVEENIQDVIATGKKKAASAQETPPKPHR